MPLGTLCVIYLLQVVIQKTIDPERCIQSLSHAMCKAIFFRHLISGAVMKFGRILSLIAVVIALPAWATSLTFSGNIELNVVDGKPYKTEGGLFSSKAPQLELANGDHQLVLRIEDLYSEGENQTIYNSAYYVITLKTEGKNTLKLSPQGVKNLIQAQRFDNNPRFKLVTGKGTAYPFRMAKLEKDGLQLGRNLAQELREFNATGHDAALAARAPAAQAYVHYGTPSALPKGRGDATMSDQMLRYWFQQADSETRTRFLNWANKSMQK